MLPTVLWRRVVVAMPRPASARSMPSARKPNPEPLIAKHRRLAIRYEDAAAACAIQLNAARAPRARERLRAQLELDRANATFFRQKIAELLRER